mgnify:CR=1 FL=1
MEIKETCGFLDSSGKFHKTLKEAEDANTAFKIKEIERKLENFHTILEHLWYEDERDISLEKELDALREMESYKNKWWVKYKWW